MMISSVAGSSISGHRQREARTGGGRGEIASPAPSVTNEIFTKVVALILVGADAGAYPLIKHAAPSDRPGEITALKTAPGTDLTTVLSADTPSFLDEELAACGTAGHRPDHGIHEVRNVVDRCFSRLSSSAPFRYASTRSPPVTGPNSALRHSSSGSADPAEIVRQSRPRPLTSRFTVSMYRFSVHAWSTHSGPRHDRTASR